MRKFAMMAALLVPLFTGCLQAGTIVVNAQATVPGSVVNDAVGAWKELSDSDAASTNPTPQPDDEEPTPHVTVQPTSQPTEEPIQQATPTPTPSPSPTPTPVIVKHKVAGAVRRMSGKSPADLTVVITLRQVGSPQMIIATGSVAPDGSFEVESRSGEFALFITQGGITDILPDSQGRVQLTYSKDSNAPAPKIDLSVPSNPDASVGFVLITVMEWLDNI